LLLVSAGVGGGLSPRRRFGQEKRPIAAVLGDFDALHEPTSGGSATSRRPARGLPQRDEALAVHGSPARLRATPV
jgi:hypothetical protein